jgi:glycosyltransferase involved in cell wall biosynthesis
MTLGIVYHMPFWRGTGGELREAEGSFARYVDSLAPYFDRIVLCVPFRDDTSDDGTAIAASNVTVAPLVAFDGPAQFYLRLPAMLGGIARFVRGIDLLHGRVPTPAAVFAFAFARLLRRRSFVLVVGDLEALRASMPYRGLKKLLWRAYTAFEERNVQWMVDRSVAFANGAALAAKHSRPGRPVIETRTSTIRLEDVRFRPDTCVASRVRLLTVSRIDPRKGLRILPDAIARIVAAGVDAAIDIVGPPVGAPGGVEQRAIVESSAALGVADRVRCAGAVPLARLLPMYRDYDVFVLPTLPGEGIPRVLLEAMANGLPVVTTAVAGIPSLIVDEENGLLIADPTAASIASAVVRVVTDGALRRRVIAAGYDTARSHTVDAQAARMMADVAARLTITLRTPLPVPAS